MSKQRGNVPELKAFERLQKYGYMLPILLLPVGIVSVLWGEGSLGCSGRSTVSTSVLCGVENNPLAEELRNAFSLTSKQLVVANVNRRNWEEMQADLEKILSAISVVDYVSARTLRADSPAVQAAAAVVGKWPYGAASGMFDNLASARTQETEEKVDRPVSGGDDSRDSGNCQAFPFLAAGMAPSVCSDGASEEVPADYFSARKTLLEIADEGLGALVRSAAREEIKQGVSAEIKRYLAEMAKSSDASGLWLERMSARSGADVIYDTSYVVLVTALIVTLALSGETFWRSAWAARSAGRTERVVIRAIAFFILLLIGYNLGVDLRSGQSNVLVKFVYNSLSGGDEGAQWIDRIGLATIGVAMAAITISVVASNKEVRAWNAEKITAERADKVARRLARAWDDVQRMGMALAALLVGVILYMQALLNWPLALLGGCNAASAGGGVVALCQATSQLVTGYGVIASLLLGSLFVPAVVILRGRSEWLARSASDPDSAAISKWLEDQHLNVSFSKQIGRFLTILAPLLAAMFGDQLQNMLGLGGP